PEDAPLDNVECDNMNRFDRPDRNVRQSQEGFWKRPPQRWSGQEHYHLSHPDPYHHHGKSDLSSLKYYSLPATCPDPQTTPREN
uniref:Coiled-coil serine rich protein 2 n=1 Tax=Ictidomys tridecemlineatus TaxID=43179 RepID=A0A287CS77_ICTTR